MDKITRLDLRRQTQESKALAISALRRIAEIAQEAASETETGDLARSPAELLIEFAHELKALEQFRDDELREAIK